MRAILILSWFFLTIGIGCKQAPTETAVRSFSRVTDLAYVLTTEQANVLSQYSSELESATGSQLAIVIVSTLDGESLESQSLDQARIMKLGRATHDDGLLIYVAMSEHQFRIEVGEGLERIVTDELAARILREDMAPKFAEAKYFEGLQIGVTRIKTLIETNRDLIGQRR
jgi:uncharacterized membrane protein YgcG